MRSETEDKLKIIRNAYWLLIDEIEKRVGIEIMFGQGWHETDVAMHFLNIAEADFKEEKNANSSRL